MVGRNNVETNKQTNKPPRGHVGRRHTRQTHARQTPPLPPKQRAMAAAASGRLAATAARHGAAAARAALRALLDA
eukprot:2078342-Prymnesium_polylepis.1